MNFFPRSIFLFFVIIIFSGCNSSSSSKSDEQGIITNEEVPVEEADSSAACESLNEEAVRISVENFSVMAGNSDYKLYLEDFFNALQAADNEELTSDERSMLNAITSKINDYLHYELSQGSVTRAENPLDYIEQVISSSTSAGPIQEAKEMLSALIQNDGSSFCHYRNRDIIISDLEGNHLWAFQLDFNFNPFNNSFQQTVLMEENSSSLDNSHTNMATRYFGFFKAAPGAFTDNGFTPPEVRFASMQNAASNEILTIDDGYDYKQGMVALNFTNTYCDQQTEDSDPSNYSDCATDIQTRAVQKEQCDGSHEGDINEVNKLAIHSFDLNSNLTNIKRLRIEIDYVSEEVKVFASQYNEAIFDSDGTTIIKDPTNCEKQAVLEELFELNRNIAEVRLTIVPDSTYDYQYLVDENGALVKDENGESIIINEPSPLIHYLGSSVPSRK